MDLLTAQRHYRPMSLLVRIIVLCRHWKVTGNPLISVSIHSITFYSELILHNNFPSMLWHCWLGDRKGIRPVKKQGVGLSVMIWLELSTSYISPLAPIKSRMETFWYRLTQVHNKTWNKKKLLDNYWQLKLCKIPDPNNKWQQYFI